MPPLLSYLTWDPNPALFNFSLPLLNRPILWYGFFFALGFFLGYQVLLRVLRSYFDFDRENLSKFAEKLAIYVALGAVIGARLGDVLFYQNLSSFLNDPLSLIAIWEGGLASHGGAIGMLFAIALFARHVKIPFFQVVDFVVIPTAIAGSCIRIGNFFNQEILGIPTTLPWAVLFLHPADGGSIVPRHPAQLYEAIFYLFIFFLLFSIRKNPYFSKQVGRLTGLFLVLIFSFRFLIEFLKVEQSSSISSSSPLTMGQWLSIPFILLGLVLLWKRMPPSIANKTKN